MHRTGRRRLWGALAIVVVGGLLLAACGDDDDSTSSAGGGGTATTAAASAALGAENKATGTPVKLGLVSDGKSDTIDNTSEVQAAKAAVQYVNNYLGGVAGHPIDLTVCETKQTPSGATDCATKMVDAKVSAVLVGVSGQSGSIFKGLEGSGIPFFSYANIDQDVLIKPGAFVMTNGLSAIAGPAQIAKDKGVTKAAVVVSDVPAASGPVNAVGKIFYKNAGVDLTVVPVAPSVADPTPQVQSAIAGGAKAFAIIGNPTLCTGALKAMRTLGFQGPITLIPQCIDESSGSAIPNGYEGMLLVTSTTDDPSDPDFKVYTAVMDKYAKGVNKGGVAPGGFIVVVGFARALEGYTGDVSAASVTQALSTMGKPVDLPLGGGITFQCGTKPVAITPNICAAKSLVGTLHKDGKATGYKTIDTSALTKLG